MPSWAHPHLQCCTAHGQALAGITVDDSSARATATPGAVGSWRWRVTALVVACISTLSLLVFVTMISTLDNVHSSSPQGASMERSWLHHPKRRNEYLLRRITLVESREFQNLSTGLMPRTPNLQQQLSFKLASDDSSSQELASSSRSPMPRPDASSNQHRRILVASGCSNKDISIFQSADGATSSMSGIPRFAVQIMNNCMSDCAPSDIHVSCGWFASALLVNPNSFKRLGFNDCIVNGGKPLRHGETLRFTYANSFMYPLRFKSATFCK